MTHTIQALVADSATSCVVTEVTLGDLPEDHVLIRSSISGFSTGTDRWVMTGRFEWGGFSFPLSPGYQVAGVVEAVGSAVTSVRVGQSVAAIVASNMEGIAAAWGCHASMVMSHHENVFDATDVPELSAAFLVSAQVGFNAASRVAAAPGAKVCVIGDGIIGTSAALAAAARGYRVLVQGRHDERLAPFTGTTIETINARNAEADALVSWAPDAVIDTVQNDSAFDAYIDALPRAVGQIVYSGHSPDGVRHWGDMAALQQRELRTDFVSGWTTERLLGTLDAMRSGAMDLAPFVSQVAHDRATANELAAAVSGGTLRATAAAIDWRQLA